METSKIYGRDILAGIGKYLHLHQPWSTYVTERGQNEDAPAWLATWKGEGIISRCLDVELCRRARDRGIAVVSLRHLEDQPEFVSVFPDQAAIGQRVAQHLVERGFQHFGYLGVDGNKRWEQLRRAAFTDTLQAAGFREVAFKPTTTSPVSADWEDVEDETAEWLRTLPKPVAIMVTHDVQGLQVLDACRRAKLRVPDEVAVVSVDNDPVLCDIANPPLSSLDQDGQRLGFEAAVLLDQMMQGREVPVENHYTEPGHVATRQSSDVIAVADEKLSRAIRFIRENSSKDIDVQMVAKVAGISRRALEKKFGERIGRTPLEEIMQVRFQRVRRLLLETDYTLARIAEMTGFQYQEYLVRFFKRHAGLAPGQYRRKHRFEA